MTLGAGFAADAQTATRWSGPLGHVFRNFTWVIGGQAASSIMGLVALTLNSRALDLHSLGVLFIIQASCELISRVLAFQNWQTLIKFGTEAIHQRDGVRLLAAWRFGFLLDFAAAAVASLIAVSLFLFVPELIGLDAESGKLGLFYACSLLLLCSSTSIGALRLCEAFPVVVLADTTASAYLLFNAVLLFVLEAPLEVYLVTIPAGAALVSIFLLIAGRRKIVHAAHELNAAAEVRHRLDRADFFRFALGASAGGTLSAIRQRAELLLVGAILDPAASALYGVAFRLASLLARAAEAGRQAVYPVIGRLIAERSVPQAAALAYRLGLIGAIVAVPFMAILVVYGRDALALLFGTEFRSAYPNLLLLAAGTMIYTAMFAFGPFIQLEIGTGRFLLLTAIAFIAFLVFGGLGPWLFGQAGAGAGAGAYGFVLAVLTTTQMQLRLRTLRGG